MLGHPARSEHGLPARLLHLLLILCGRLPLGLLRHLGAALGRLWLLAGFREARVARRNLELCFPDQDASARRQLLVQTLRHTGMTASELPWLWSRDPATLAARIRVVEGESLFDAALASGRGVLIAAPHLGNWEALNLWLSARTPIAILYRPPRQAWVETLINRWRGRLGAEPVRADAAGVRTLVRRLKAGGVVGILPDQQPKVGEGVFAPFFGHPALTMSLFCKLAGRTSARVLHAWAERTAEGFAVHISDRGVPADESGLNAAIEAQARLAPGQYQWTYKRFGLQPGGAPSPYRQG
jgi:KDO2-lipid IV(A) lauroyltransferase